MIASSAVCFYNPPTVIRTAPLLKRTAAPAICRLKMPTTTEAVVKQTTENLLRRKENKESIRSLFKHKKVQYAADDSSN